jgi:ATP-binding cassette subfamily B multidrug efflux pump
MNSDLSDEEIWKFIDLAGLKEDVESFPNKLDTQLGEWGINLSGGQKQRLTLARALARKPKLLFLDDCLSAVDTITEERILKNLDQHLKDVTLVWVAHRKSTLKYCNQTFELKPMMDSLQ